MHDNKKVGMFIIKIGDPSEDSNDSYKEDKKEDRKEERKGKREGEREEKEFSLEQYGGYTPQDLVKKLEEVKESISNQNTREALMRIDSCIVRLTKKGFPSKKDNNPFVSDNYQLDKLLPNPGKS
ncbi:hypothetical protein CL622_07385 [archaeon]|nr:hypothetical protein [archaeon]